MLEGSGLLILYTLLLITVENLSDSQGIRFRYVADFYCRKVKESLTCLHLGASGQERFEYPI